MSSMTRTSTALGLALAIAALASVVDGCVVFCVAQRPASANVPPACHHARSAALQIGRVPTPCTHTYMGIVTLRADRLRFTRITDSIVAIAFAPASLDRMAPKIVRPVTRPQPLPIALDRSFALRI